MLTVGFKNAVSIELTAFLAFFVFCEQAVPSYSNVRKKTKFRTFLNSLQRAENICKEKVLTFGLRYVILFAQQSRAYVLPFSVK